MLEAYNNVKNFGHIVVHSRSFMMNLFCTFSIVQIFFVFLFCFSLNPTYTDLIFCSPVIKSAPEVSKRWEWCCSTNFLWLWAINNTPHSSHHFHHPRYTPINWQPDPSSPGLFIILPVQWTNFCFFVYYLSVPPTNPLISLADGTAYKNNMVYWFYRMCC